MILSQVTRLYLYRPPSDFTLKIFRDERLWASKPGSFNDPFDCDVEVTRGIAEVDVMDAVYALHGRNRDEWPREVARFIETIFDKNGTFTPKERERVDKEIQAVIDDNKNSGVVCLSEVSDAILMWSHYAKHHTGICIEFERKPDSLLGDAEICSPVQYSSKYPAVDLGRMLLSRDGQTLNLMLRHKADCWAYEKEWRLITNSGDKQCHLPGPISKVIFGVRVPDDFRAKVKAACDAKGIRTVQAVKSPMEFRILVPA
jgi:hypothetical protein